MNHADAAAKPHLWHVIFSFFYLLIFPVVLFSLAGDWYWTEGRIFSINFFVLGYAIVIYLYVEDPALLNEPFGSFAQTSQKSWDKIFLTLFVLGYLSSHAIMPLHPSRCR